MPVSLRGSFSCADVLTNSCGSAFAPRLLGPHCPDGRYSKGVAKLHASLAYRGSGAEMTLGDVGHARPIVANACDQREAFDAKSWVGISKHKSDKPTSHDQRGRISGPRALVLVLFSRIVSWNPAAVFPSSCAHNSKVLVSVFLPVIRRV